MSNQKLVVAVAVSYKPHGTRKCRWITEASLFLGGEKFAEATFGGKCKDEEIKKYIRQRPSHQDITITDTSLYELAKSFDLL